MNRGKISKLIFIIVWLVVSVGLFVAWIYLYALIGRKVSSINEIKMQAKDAELRLEQRRELEGLVGELTVKKQKIDALFLNKDTLIRFIEQLEEVSKITGVVLKINSDELKGSPVFRLAVEGQYSQIFRFLLLLENVQYKTGISSVVVQEQGDLGKWKADIELTLLSYEAKI